MNVGQTDAEDRSPRAPRKGGGWWRLQNWTLERTLILSLVLHFVGLVTATVLAMPNFDPPEELDVIPVRIFSELAPPPVPEKKSTPPPPQPVREEPQAIPDPLIPQPDPVPEPEVVKPEPEEIKPDPEPEPEPVPPEPDPDPEDASDPVPEPDSEPDPDPEPDLAEAIGAVDEQERPDIPTTRPAIGEDFQIELEGPPFEFDYYIRQMRRKISRNWMPPKDVANPGVKISALVRFRVLPNGEVAGAEIVETSNSFVFDQAVLRSLNQASPLPPLPKKYVHPELGVKLRFVYQQ